jgi:Hsp70 protein
VRSVKRALGKDFDSADVQADMKHWLYKAVTGRDQKPAIQIIHAASEEHISIRDIFVNLIIKLKARLKTTVVNASVKLSFLCQVRSIQHRDKLSVMQQKHLDLQCCD